MINNQNKKEDEIMEMKLDIVYKIGKSESWRSKKGVKIESNISKDELIECEIAQSLVDYLKKESAILEPDKLLLGFAEAQKRDIQANLEAFNDMELTAKNTADAVQQKLLKSYNDSEEKYLALEKKFTETRKKFIEKINSTSEKFKDELEYLEKISEKLSKIDNYGLERLSTTLSKIIELVEKDKDIVKIVFNSRLNKK